MHLNIPSLFDLTGKTAFITGASSGLRKRFSYVLSEAGATVIIAARRYDYLEELCVSLRNRGAKVHAFFMDLVDLKSIEETVKKSIELYGRIDILVNNAGIFETTPLIRKKEEIFDRVFKTNVYGTWYVTQHIARHMIKAGIEGSIINIASISGHLKPLKTAGAYAASKASIIHFTKQLVGELSPHKIRINTLMPGLIDTDMTHTQIQKHKKEIEELIPINFIGDVTDLDAALLFLASNKASRYVTGTCLTVDGGLSWGGI